VTGQSCGRKPRPAKGDRRRQITWSVTAVPFFFAGIAVFRGGRMSTTLPVSDLDPFSDELLNEPYEYYRSLRDAGPLVYMERYDMVAAARFEDVRAALRDWRTFSSRRGNAFNDLMNQNVAGTITSLEPPEHDAVRGMMTERLKLSEMRSVAPIADHRADEMVGALVERGTFDGVKELAEPFVAGVVGDLLGIPESVLDLFVAAGSEAFTLMGPMNDRMKAGMPLFYELIEVMQKLTKEDMRPASIGWSILEEAERGVIPEKTPFQLLMGFTGPAFDTTINAIGNAMWLLANNPDQWELLRGEPSLIPAAINEVVRCESPIQIWGRFAFEEAMVDTATVPGPIRVAVVLGSANRDERHYHDPDTFDIRRNPADQVGFGHGIHLCVGAPLARVEMTSVLKALLRSVRTLTLTGDPTRRLNNTTRGFENLPLAVS